MIVATARVVVTDDDTIDCATVNVRKIRKVDNATSKVEHKCSSLETFGCRGISVIIFVVADYWKEQALDER